MTCNCSGGKEIRYDSTGMPGNDPRNIGNVTVTTTVKKSTSTAYSPAPSIPAGAQPLPFNPSPLEPVPPSTPPAPVIPMNPPTVNPSPLVEALPLLGKFFGTIVGVLIPTPTGLGASSVPNPFAPDPFGGHGNDRNNSNPHIVYTFTFSPTDGGTPVLKYGISDVSRYGMDRPENQRAGLIARFGSTVSRPIIITRTLNRAQALFVERLLVTKHWQQWNGGPRAQDRPGPF